MTQRQASRGCHALRTSQWFTAGLAGGGAHMIAAASVSLCAPPRPLTRAFDALRTSASSGGSLAFPIALRSVFGSRGSRRFGERPGSMSSPARRRPHDATFGRQAADGSTDTWLGGEGLEGKRHTRLNAHAGGACGGNHRTGGSGGGGAGGGGGSGGGGAAAGLHLSRCSRPRCCCPLRREDV